MYLLELLESHTEGVTSQRTVQRQSATPVQETLTSVAREPLTSKCAQPPLLRFLLTPPFYLFLPRLFPFHIFLAHSLLFMCLTLLSSPRMELKNIFSMFIEQSQIFSPLSLYLEDSVFYFQRARSVLIYVYI